MKWRLCREPRPPHFQIAVGFYVSHTSISVLLLFWTLTWWPRERAL